MADSGLLAEKPEAVKDLLLWLRENDFDIHRVCVGEIEVVATDTKAALVPPEKQDVEKQHASALEAFAEKFGVPR